MAAALADAGVAVDALGRCRGGGGAAPREAHAGDRFAARWHDAAVAAYAPHAFVVAFENDDAPGYVTEKLALALLAGAVPVYWGPPTAIFNEDAFIRCGDDLGACAARVAAVAANFSAYRRLAEAPPLAPGGLALLDGTAAVADALAGLRPDH